MLVEAERLEHLLVVQPLAALEVVDEREARGGVEDVLAQDGLAVLLLLDLVVQDLGGCVCMCVCVCSACVCIVCVCGVCV